MTIAAFCNRNAVAIRRTESVIEAARQMRKHHVGSLVIVEDNAQGEKIPVGIITDRDIAVSVTALALDPAVITVNEVMGDSVVCVNESAGIAETVALMRSKGVRRLPVVNDAGALTGIPSKFREARALCRDARLRGACRIGERFRGAAGMGCLFGPDHGAAPAIQYFHGILHAADCRECAASFHEAAGGLDFGSHGARGKSVLPQHAGVGYADGALAAASPIEVCRVDIGEQKEGVCLQFAREQRGTQIFVDYRFDAAQRTRWQGAYRYPTAARADDNGPRIQ